MKFGSVILYESNEVEKNFYPFSVLHPLWEFRVGAMRIFEKYQRVFDSSQISFYSPNQIILESFLTRFELNNVSEQSVKNLYLSSQLLASELVKTQIESLITSDTIDYVIRLKGKVVGYYTEQSIEGLINSSEYPNFTVIELASETPYLNYIWDAISHNETVLFDDEKYFLEHNSSKEYEGVYTINKNKVKIHHSAKIHPNVVIDATEGAVIIDKNATIMAGSTILGPCYIGCGTIIKIGAKIYGNTSIGEVCKVGGEVEGSIIQSYSNKQHDGFLGHSFISEWVNLGADTNTSDLKNTYSEITVQQRDREIKTGTIFLGLICGDHTKSAINTQFNTGTIAGVCGILVRPGFLPNHIKSFSWGGLQTSPSYKISKAIEVCEIVMGRRNKTLNDYERQLLQIEYDKIK